jgi:hypothetical protein
MTTTSKPPRIMSLKSQEKRITRQLVKLAPENRIDKIQKYLFQADVDLLAHDKAIELSEDETRILERLKKTFSMILDNSEIKTARLLQSIYKVSYRQARIYIQQSKQLFGQHIGEEKPIARAIQVQRREREIELIRRDRLIDPLDKYALISKHYEQIEKIKQLDREDIPTLADLKEILTIPIPVRSTDPAFLNIDQVDDAQVIKEA